jgi:site-specific recombinase XerD
MANKKTTANDELEDLVEEYLDACKANGVKASTLEGTYGYSLRKVFLESFCKPKGVRRLAQVDSRLLVQFANDLKGRPAKNKFDEDGKPKRLSEHTIFTYRRAVNQFLNWVREDGRVEVAAAKNPKLGHLPKNLPDVLERDEIDKLERLAESERDKLIVRVLADTGMRLGELLALTVDDIVVRHGKDYIRIRHGKGDKERLVPLHEPLLSQLTDYGHRDRRVDEEAKHIFTSLKRIPGNGFEPLTKSGVQQMIRKLGEDAGLKKRVYPHLFRHSFITWLVIKGVPLLQIMEIVGHSDMQMLQKYTHLAPANAYDAMAGLFKGRKGPRAA